MRIEEKTSLAELERLDREMIAMNNAIADFAEPSLEEVKSAETLKSFLAANGFDVQSGVAGLPTAFVAEAGDEGPTIAYMCEYDATPGDSQEVVPWESPIGLAEAGFPDLHNGIGVASAAAAVATLRAINDHGLRGRVRVLGTPAEKLCVGKPFMARDGYFDGLSAVIAWHPRSYSTVEWDSGPACIEAKLFDFKGKSAYAAKPWVGVDALDAVRLMHISVEFMMKRLDARHRATVNDIITAGGQHPTAIPSHAQVWYSYRALDRTGIAAISDILERAAEAASHVVGTRFASRLITATRPWLPNHVLAQHCYEALADVGGPKISVEMKEFGEKVLIELGRTDAIVAGSGYDEDVTPLQDRASSEFIGGTDDVTEFCWHAPTARIYVAYGLRGKDYPNWAGSVFAKSSAAHETVRVASRAMALSGVRLILSPEVMQNAQEEFRSRSADSPSQEPLVGEDVVAPTGLPFPPAASSKDEVRSLFPRLDS